MRAALLMATVALGVAGCTGAAEDRRAASPAQLEARLTARNDSLLDSVRRGRADEVAEYFTDDALLLPPDGSTVRGKDAVRSFWEEGTGFDSVATAPFMFRADAALATQAGRYTIWSTDASGAPVTSSGIFLLIWERSNDGIWRVRTDMWN